MSGDNHQDAADLNVALLPGFDPGLHPIIARHWFGLVNQGVRPPANGSVTMIESDAK